jgi:hypothetical protein
LPTRAGSPQQHMPIYITHPVNFPCGRKPEYPEKTHDFRQSIDFLLFSHEDWVWIALRKFSLRLEPTAFIEVKGKYANNFATNIAVLTLICRHWFVFLRYRSKYVCILFQSWTTLHFQIIKRSIRIQYYRDGFTGGGVLFFMIKQKIIRDKMRYSNLSNDMMISELWTTITIQMQ